MGLPLRPGIASRRRSLWAGSVLAFALATLALTVPAAGPHGPRPRPPERLPERTVYAIDLPFEEPPHVPAGPNREQFTAYCRLCHSPRLVLTQPRLSETKWDEVVRKMVTTYGAPVPPDQERAVVAYLMAVRGPGPDPLPRPTQ